MQLSCSLLTVWKPLIYTEAAVAMTRWLLKSEDNLRVVICLSRLNMLYSGVSLIRAHRPFNGHFSVAIFLVLAQENDSPILNFTCKALIASIARENSHQWAPHIFESLKRNLRCGRWLEAWNPAIQLVWSQTKVWHFMLRCSSRWWKTSDVFKIHESDASNVFLCRRNITCLTGIISHSQKT